MATDKSYAERLPAGEAIAAVLWQGADWEALGLRAAIVPRRPRYAMSSLTRILDQGQGFPPGIHDSAIVDATAEIGLMTFNGDQQFIRVHSLAVRSSYV